MPARDAEPPIVLSGPTAVGKSAVAVALARRLDAEIVSVDSALVYRRLDIGTAKPTLAERGGVAHHLIDLREPWEIYSAADFVADALGAIAAIRARGRRALLVGGTLLYVRALARGLAPLPSADPALRAQIAREAERRGWPALHAELAGLDPAVAARVHPNDPQRLQRALEVYRLTGVPLGEWQRRTRAPLERPPLVLALVPERREWLHARIATRLEAMVAAGFVDEVRALRREPRVHAGLPAIRSVGYRQAWAYLDATEGPAAGDRAAGVLPAVPPAAAAIGGAPDWRARARAATRQLAKRQLTWLRGMDALETLGCDTLSVEACTEALLRRLAAHGVKPP